MNILEGINFLRDHHVSTLKQSTQHSYNYLLSAYSSLKGIR
jgi:hypothetical protein